LEKHREALDSYYLAGDGIAIRRVRSQLQRIAPYFRTALVTGEAGTGKETVARALHERSPGARGPFVVWRAAEFEQKLLQCSHQSDILREAHRGTLFLDGLSCMPLPLQASLLRLLQQHHGPRSQRYDLRIVASDDGALRARATTGQFREELYRRIAAVEITLIPLRLRQEDIATVSKTLLRQGAGIVAITAEAVACLERHHWSENVRELINVLEDASTATQAQGGMIVEPQHLSLLRREQDATQPVPEQHLERLEDIVQRHVLDVLTRCAGNKLRASEVLGISRSTLYRMLDASTIGAHSSTPPGFRTAGPHSRLR